MMKKFLLRILFFVFILSATGVGAHEEGNGRVYDWIPDRRDSATSSEDTACRCCEKCMAARKPVDPQDEEAPATGGCGDCCDRCGKTKKSPSKDAPPEMIRKDRK